MVGDNRKSISLCAAGGRGGGSEGGGGTLRARIWIQ